MELPSQIETKACNYTEPVDFSNERSGNLQGRQVKKIHYAEFGEKIAQDDWLSWKKIGKIALIVFGVITLPLGVGILLLYAAEKIDTKPIVPEALPNTLDPVRLGKYYQADIRLTATADEGFTWKKRLISSAEHSIELSCNFAGGSHFREILSLVDERMQKNSKLKVHLISSVDLLEKNDREELQRLQTLYGERFQNLVTDRSLKVGLSIHTEENHVKMLVVDGKYFVGGGTGIHPQLCRAQYDKAQDNETPTNSAKLLPPAANDLDIVGHSLQIAQVMRKQFFNLYQLYETGPNRHFPIDGPQGTCDAFTEEPGLIENVRLKFIVGGPEHRGANPINLHYAKRIEEAKSEIRLANWEFNPSSEVREALHKAKNPLNRKKVVFHATGLPHLGLLARTLLVLINRGAYSLADKVYEYQEPDAWIHKKVGTFDDSHMMIGSYNLGKKSAHFDHEVAFVIKDSRVTNLCKKNLKNDKLSSTKLKRAEIENNQIGYALVSAIPTILMENFL